MKLLSNLKTAILSTTILVIFSALIGCTPNTTESCNGYCQSELECGVLNVDEKAGCISMCTQRVNNATENCNVSFREYAECYDDSASCKAENCYSKFVAFAEQCNWYLDEIALR